MSRYFDKKFWKMFSGFILIIAVSITIIAALRIYEDHKIEVSHQTNIANPK